MGASAARLGAGNSHGGTKQHGGGGGSGRGKGPAGGGETPERHAAKNLEIFEQNLAALSLPKGAAGKGAGGGRYGCFVVDLLHVLKVQVVEVPFGLLQLLWRAPSGKKSYMERMREEYRGRLSFQRESRVGLTYGLERPSASRLWGRC